MWGQLGEPTLLVAAGFGAGVINTLAGGGSLLTVPLLVLLGLPGNIANGTNRVGVLFQNLTSIWQFRAEGLSGLREATPLLAPVMAGSVFGALSISRLDDSTFERLFGIAMVALLIPILRKPKPKSDPNESRWPLAVRVAVFFAIGAYGGAFQAGVGIPLVLALAHSGFDLVRSNAIKVVVIASLTLVAVPIFVWNGHVAWWAALFLTIGFALGGAVGARIAVRGGERIIRPVLVAVVAVLAVRMLGWL